MFHRVREASSGLVAVHPNSCAMVSRWIARYHSLRSRRIYPSFVDGQREWLAEAQNRRSGESRTLCDQD